MENNDKNNSNETNENDVSDELLSSSSTSELCAVGSIVEGVVSGIAKFGAFVDLPDKRTGLVHISQISDKYVREVRDYLEIGQKVNIYIMSCEGEKVRLSIKEAHSKLGIPQLSPINMSAVSGGAVDQNFERLMNDFKHQAIDADFDNRNRYDRKIR